MTVYYLAGLPQQSFIVSRLLTLTVLAVPPLVCAVDHAGDLFVVERDGHRVRKIDMKTRVVSTVAGTGEQGFAGDGGSATTAQLSQPHSIQVCLHDSCSRVCYQC